MTEISSQGLLPQLTDVLHVLTDSHELLRLKLQSVRLEYTNTEVSPRAQSRDEVDPRPAALGDPTTDTTSAVRQPFKIDEIEPGAAPGGSASSESDVRASFVAASTQSHMETPAQPLPPPEVVTPRGDVDDVLHAELPTPGERPLAAPADQSPADPTGAERANHNYNFFDELDARLGQLQDPDSGSGAS